MQNLMSNLTSFLAISKINNSGVNYVTDSDCYKIGDGESGFSKGEYVSLPRTRKSILHLFLMPSIVY